MKKIFALLLTTSLIFSSTTVVFAKCGGRQNVSRKNSVIEFSVCTIKECQKSGLHLHNQKSYSAHYYNDGHDYHEYCDVTGCKSTGYHEHDDVYCFAQTSNDGHKHGNARNNARKNHH